MGTVAVLVAANVGLGAMLASARPEGVALAVLPVIVVAIGALIASNRAILIFAAFALALFVPVTPTGALPGPGGISVYPSDLLVVLAVASWVAAWLTRPAYARPSWPETQVLGWPLLLFGIPLVTAIVRGHERYGEKLLSVPVRFLLYAGIAAAVTDLKPRDTYRWLVGLFYVGVVWQVLVALYGYATGWTVDQQGAVSTGGERVLASSTAMFMAGALLLALLNLEFDRSARRTALHLVMAGLATFALASTLARTTFAGISARPARRRSFPAIVRPVPRPHRPSCPDGRAKLLPHARPPSHGEPDNRHVRALALEGDQRDLATGPRGPTDRRGLRTDGELRGQSATHDLHPGPS
jgi:hypothetical protein